MSDLQQKIDAATSQLAASQQSASTHRANWETLTKEASALEQLARDKRAEAAKEKELAAADDKAAAELDAVLRHSQVQKSVEDAAAATFKAKTDAEAAKTEADSTLARLTAKEKQLDELLAKAAAEQKSPQE
jgi:hypothetical protein